MALRAAILLAGEMLLLVDSRMIGDVVCFRWKSADVAVGEGFVTTDDSEGTASEQKG